jgi:non-specific protein-tyrosine kinase
MNLRKTQERVKTERDAGAETAAAPVADPDGNSESRSVSTWHPPVYAESRTVSIDVNTAVENHCVALSPDFAEVDYYKILRTQLRHIGKRKNWNTIMVTSVSPGEGKTVTAVNLAATFAREFSQTALLVDADLRMQSIHRYLGYQSQAGLVDYLEGRRPMNDIIAWPGIEKLTIISGGRVVEDSAELMGSPRMQDLVSELKSRYDDRSVIFDVPPVLGGADTLAFAPLVDCIILVVGAGAARRQDLSTALDLLPQEKIAGFVLNRFHGANSLYGRNGGGKRTEG